jgi:hypothetical protein
MLSLAEATAAELRAIADFYEDPQHAIDDLLDLSLIPVVEAGDGKPDKIIGFEKGDCHPVAHREP